jgi:hypothetical protein
MATYFFLWRLMNFVIIIIIIFLQLGFSPVAVVQQ